MQEIFWFILLSIIALLMICIFVNAIWYPVLEEKAIEKKREMSIEERIRYMGILRKYSYIVINDKNDLEFYDIMNLRYPFDTLSMILDEVYKNRRSPYGIFNR